MRARDTLLQGIGLLFVLLLFFVGVELMGASFELMSRGTVEALLRATSDPFVGLFIGILATSLVQSSSTVTSITVAVVAGGGLNIPQAIPIVMGANIGTSVTNTLVAFGSVTRRGEFRQAVAGATVHDFFNLLAVAVLFPLELAFGVVSRPALALTEGLAGAGGLELLSPLDHLVVPLMEGIIALAGARGPLVLAIGLVLLFLSLRLVVKLLRALFLERFEGLLDRYIFGQPLVSFLLGVGLTFVVQSSSITTSLAVPLVGAGVLTVAQIFPFVLGANMGTTLTAIVAALALARPEALTVAFAHLMFNMLGLVIFFPVRQLRAIPLWLAEGMGRLAERHRFYMVGYVAAVFFVVPLAVIGATRVTGLEYESEPIERTVPPRDSAQNPNLGVVPRSVLAGQVSGLNAGRPLVLMGVIRVEGERGRAAGGVGVAPDGEAAAPIIVGGRLVASGNVTVGPDERAGTDDRQNDIVDKHGASGRRFLGSFFPRRRAAECLFENRFCRNDAQTSP